MGRLHKSTQLQRLEHIMKTLAILSLVLAAGAAMAAEPGSYNPSTAAGAWSRAEVNAEFSNAMKGDMLPQTGEVGTTSVATKANSSRDVAAVRAEARMAVRGHQTIGGEV
jgi:hypothetical protein